jgi:hypothetical protein
VATQAWFTTTETQVVPGTTTSLSLLVSNLGEHTERYALSPTGVAAPWTTLRPAYLTIFPGSHQSVDVEVTAPRPPAATAGPSALGVRVVPHSEPDEVVNADVTLEVAPAHVRRLALLDPAVRSKRRATYDVLVENLGNAPAVCQLHFIEPSGRLEGSVDTPVVRVDPGGSALVQVRVRARRLLWDRRTRSIPFRVDADEPGAPSASSAGSFLQTPVLPERFGLRLFGGLAAGAALGAIWLAVVRPHVERTVDRAVTELRASTPIVADGTVPAPEAASPVPAAVPENDPVRLGEPFSETVPGAAAAGQQSAETVTVPDDSVLEVTQLIVQNPYGDEGSVVVSLGDVRLEYDLDDLDGVDANQGFVEPVRIGPGAQIAVEVSCAVVGRPGAASCSVSATLLGRIVPTVD